MALGYIGFIAILVLVVFSFKWMWKTFAAVNRPGWWVLFNIVAILGNIIFLILLGSAACGNKELPMVKKRGSKKK